MIMHLFPVGGSPEHAGFPGALEFILMPEVSLASCMIAQLDRFHDVAIIQFLPMQACTVGWVVTLFRHSVACPIHACTGCGVPMNTLRNTSVGEQF